MSRMTISGFSTSPMSFSTPTRQCLMKNGVPPLHPAASAPCRSAGNIARTLASTAAALNPSPTTTWMFGGSEHDGEVLNSVLIGAGMIGVTGVHSHGQAGEFAHEVIFEAGTLNLLGVVEILRTDEAYDRVHL